MRTFKYEVQVAGCFNDWHDAGRTNSPKRVEAIVRKEMNRGEQVRVLVDGKVRGSDEHVTRNA